MDLPLIRSIFTEKSSIGKLILPDGGFFYSLEDKDRGLKQSMSISEIASIKIPTLTAIPYGRYELAITYSPRFKRRLPILLSVPGFIGVRIHNGSFSTNTEGCILLGKHNPSADFINGSVDAIQEFIPMLEKWMEMDKVFIDIQKIAA